jgi:very-short-patch-repair endonuclease
MPHRLPEVVTRQQALAAGLSRKAIAHRMRTGQWQRPHPRVYVTYSGPLTEESRLAAALAYAGEGAALSHETALVRHGLRARKEPLHITVGQERRVAGRPGLVVHHSRLWSDGDLRVVRGLACTNLERTVLDLVDAAKTPGAAAAVIVDAVGSRRTTAGRLRVALQSRPNLRHHAAMTMVLAEAQDGAHSPLELMFGRNCRRHRVPVGARQVRQVLDGKVTYHDNFVEEFDLVTELDGLLNHDGALEEFRDMDRDNANTEAGHVVLRVGWIAMLDRPCDVARQRASVLRKRGWQGSPIGCGPGCSVRGETSAAEPKAPQEGPPPQQSKPDKSGDERKAPPGGPPPQQLDRRAG